MSTREGGVSGRGGPERPGVSENPKEEERTDEVLEEEEKNNFPGLTGRGGRTKRGNNLSWSTCRNL